MKVGLITIYHVPNYGSVLQAYATQVLLEMMGARCSVINYKYPNEWHWAHGATRNTGIHAFVRKLFPDKKTRILNEFRNQYFHFTKKYPSLAELNSENWDDFDAFIVGSDQVWNVRFMLGDSTFLLSFVPDCIPRYSLASSFALQSIPMQYKKKYCLELSKFSALSVREQNGVSIIQDNLRIDKPVEILLDPTLLLSKEQWRQHIPRSKFKKRHPYILFYMWDYAFDPKPYIFEVAKHFQAQTGCDVIALEGYRKPQEACGLIMEKRTTSTIPEFIDLFANAELVITSSFHGTAFAVNFGIPLISIIPKTGGDDRQQTLLRNIGLSHCIIHIGTAMPDINPNYDRKKVQMRLEQIRDKNKLWINQYIFQPHDKEVD